MRYFKIKAPPKGPTNVPVNPADDEDTDSGVDDSASSPENDAGPADYADSSFDDSISDGVLPKAGLYFQSWPYS